MDKLEKLKWQIHLETSITQIMLWVILWRLFGGWLGYVAFVCILGNLVTLWQAAGKVGKDYFKDNE